MAEHPDKASQSSCSPTDLTGVTLGKYRLVEKLGQGGMAQVYKAYQPGLDRYVAVKILHPHLTGDEEFAARFRREARAIAALEHPHSVRVYDFDTDHDLAFIVMEYLSGTGLKARLRDLSGRGEYMELAEVGRIVGALADALDHAHAHGVIHRDIKPSNVLITADGRPVLTDFGIAKMIDATLITGNSSTLGTPAYMSPEQCRGESGDARSDIYALGVMLYQLCTNHLPFDADTPYATILKHLTAPLPPPRSVRPDLPMRLESVILKALAKNPDDRYQSAGAMSRAVRAAMEPGTAAKGILSALDVLRVRRLWILREKAIWPGAAALALILLVGAALYFLSEPGRTEGLLAHSIFAPPEAGRSTLILKGPRLLDEIWLDPDNPEQSRFAAERVRLRSPHTPDRVLIGFNFSRLPPEATAISATLTLRVEPHANQFFPGSVGAYRMLTPWKPTTATYNSPWSAPGLQALQDYDPMPVTIAPLRDTGWLALDVTPAIVTWQSRGRFAGGLALMLTGDSDSRCDYWIYTTDHPDSPYRPTLRIFYKVAR